MSDSCSSHRSDTQLIHAGRNPAAYGGIVNPPVERASTILFPNVAALEASEPNWHSQPFYGRYGTPTTFAFEQAIADIEGGYRAIAVSSGVAALSTALAAFVKPNDDILMVDTVYGPSRKFCDAFLATYGISTRYYAPDIGADIASLIQPNTKVVYCEAPGSLTMEMQDIPAITKVAKANGCKVIVDNTWATPLFFKPFIHGVDVSIHAATKYMVGHSDALLGVIVSNQSSFMALKKTASLFGHHAAPDTIYLAQRGLRSMGVRLRQHYQNALTIARWLETRPEVAQVLYPALPSHGGHALWQRDFSGASGLLTVVFNDSISKQKVAAMVDSLTLFGIGFSWGGYESLALPVDLRGIRTVTNWGNHQLVRLHIGLEDVADLQADLSQALHHLA